MDPGMPSTGNHVKNVLRGKGWWWNLEYECQVEENMEHGYQVRENV